MNIGLTKEIKKLHKSFLLRNKIYLHFIFGFIKLLQASQNEFNPDIIESVYVKRANEETSKRIEEIIAIRQQSILYDNLFKNKIYEDIFQKTINHLATNLKNSKLYTFLKNQNEVFYRFILNPELKKEIININNIIKEIDELIPIDKREPLKICLCQRNHGIVCFNKNLNDDASERIRILYDVLNDKTRIIIRKFQSFIQSLVIPLNDIDKRECVVEVILKHGFKVEDFDDDFLQKTKFDKDYFDIKRFKKTLDEDQFTNLLDEDVAEIKENIYKSKNNDHISVYNMLFKNSISKFTRDYQNNIYEVLRKIKGHIRAIYGIVSNQKSGEIEYMHIENLNLNMKSALEYFKTMDPNYIETKHDDNPIEGHKCNDVFQHETASGNNDVTHSKKVQNKFYELKSQEVETECTRAPKNFNDEMKKYHVLDELTNCFPEHLKKSIIIFINDKFYEKRDLFEKALDLTKE